MIHVLGLSGGKDSTCLALAMRERHPEIDMEYICTPTGNELPELFAHLDRMETMLGKPIKRLNRIREGNAVCAHSNTLATVSQTSDGAGSLIWVVVLADVATIACSNEMEARHIAGAINFGAVWIV
jgi:hypothetical protein